MDDEFNNKNTVGSERDVVETTVATGSVGRDADSKKKQLGWKIAVGVLALIVVVLAGTLAWCMLTRGDSEGQGSASGGDDATLDGSEGAEDDAEEFLKQDEAVREVVAAIKEKALELLDPYKLVDSIYDVEVPYKPEGFLTAIQLNRGYGVKVEDSVNPTLPEKINSVDWVTEYGNVLKERGFVDTGEYYTLSSAVHSGGSLFVNEESGVVCMVEDEPRLDCSHKDWYNKADAELTNELAKVFEVATGEEVGYLVATVESIQNSSVAPYQRIYAGRSGYRSSFYRVSPDAEWVYFASGQDGPACAEYNTEDLKKAFAGTRCWGEGEYLEVEP